MLYRFLLAKLHIDSLRYKPTITDVKNTLRHLPRGSEALNLAYREAVERIQAQPEEYREPAKRIISWITLARRPLSVTELRHALAVESDKPYLDEDSLLEAEDMPSFCAGLVTIDDQSSIIRLVHYTAQECFQQILPSLIPNAHSDIARVRLEYLQFDRLAIGPL